MSDDEEGDKKMPPSKDNDGKRKPVDEASLSAEELQSLEEKRAYNRHCASQGG